MSRKGILTVVSGFSGAGKGTLMKALLKKYDYELSISATTRAPREGEVHGREYFFLTRDDFESMIESRKLIEWAEYVGNYYGTPKEYVEQQLEAGKDVILEIEIQGALKVKEIFPEALLLFITPPNITELKSRLVGRGTETMETIKKRLDRASEEASYMEYYDYIIVNDDLNECVETTHQVIVNEHNKVSQNKNFIEAITAELKAMKEGEI
ncbi:MAG: guanylate kinase [bacterium]|nr:guanylate kinase [bacterium]